MTRPVAVARAIRDSMPLSWILLAALALALALSIHAGLRWLTGIPLVLAVPLVVHLWARALCRLESGPRLNEELDE